MVFKKGMALSPLHARQLIVHGHVTVGGRVITIPGFEVGHAEEGTIALTGVPEGPAPGPSEGAPAQEEKAEAAVAATAPPGE